MRWPLRRRRALGSGLLGLLMALGFLIVPVSDTAVALDVYTTPGTHTLNGRQWRTTCEPYSSTVERCRTEIQATTVTYSAGRYVEKYGWTFNNLTYKPSPRAQWVGNVLATPGEHTSGGRRWKTECDTQWTGRGACRSSIWMTTYTRGSSGGYVARDQWVFNNIVRFTDSGVVASFCEPDSAVGGLRYTDPGAASGSPEPSDAVAVPGSPEPSEPGAATEGTAPATAAQDTAEPLVEATQQALAASVTIRSVQHPVYPTGVLYDRLGDIEVTGTVSGGDDGAAVAVELRDAAGVVRSSSTATLSGGAFTARLAGGFVGQATLVVTSAGGEATRAVELRRADVSLTSATRIDPLGTATITGRVAPGIGDLLVQAYAAVPGGWFKTGEARTTSDGSYQLTYRHGLGTLGTTQVRMCANLPWGSTIPSSASLGIERARIANPVISNTTAAEVSATYRSGCPVGPSGLSSIRINQQSMDGRVYRGEIIVRRSRAAEVAEVFRRTFEAGFPVYQMTNPDVFGGDDLAMMAANNTSGFNCRTVVGNPYAMSPHSYGYAVDVNPWQNPYRDPTGKWHPSTAYVQRTPVVPGMLTTTSAPVKAFQSHGWSWFSGWDWHHFEKR
ncbi:M15 family metallopeptidase [Tessaracoccus sp. MC1865]|uniref:M15 family metallopeptidase n=1 Tax=Tessaracoccus sp. MC1865 TaxID=2760310 RepID=UPI00160490A1|nr:M15 family metallopeptidase [Tessaracoccus sp. MC1865]MBB1482803.1 M15 family metallopeptidase [Tessaracoccus sp. MC1865]QTO37753.1 M15 family metallopeptidase [Tessaracoccus sp. MC1865]